MKNKQAIVIGAGIVGLAAARALSQKGFSVKLFDRSQQAVGASVRNFGMIWPIGQPEGKLYERAIRSRNIWKDTCKAAGIWHEETGSLHLAYHADEMQVLTELQGIFKQQGRNVSLLDKEGITQKYETVNPVNLLGGLYSAEEMIIDPRESMAKLPGYFKELYDISFFWGKCISYISGQTVYIGNEEEHEADIIFVCSGADFETLYPEVYAAIPLTKCKLQMMRLTAQPENQRIRTALCGGLSLIHYNSFKVAPSLNDLKLRYQNEMGEYIDRGIHVMVSQNESGELTVGDSHEYGLTFDPFDKQFINTMILDYLRRFARFKDWSVTESWNGIYPKLTNGETDIFINPEKDVYILNGLGGAGMTMSFGLAEEMVDTI
ncbi:MAG: TIGR03364 family FAD-dependent oxidoreductase [Ferruginibacter sp.]|nr:TIGR03364 family FAD-dependent oxidoreductase [Ferruginibacter sp.]